MNQSKLTQIKLSLTGTKMNILLIGSSKFIGSHLLSRLIKKEDINKIFCTYLSNNQSSYYEKEKITFNKCDVRELSEVEKNLKESYADIVIYMASSRYFPKPINIYDHLEININGIKNLIDACKQSKTNPKVIFINSGSSKIDSIKSDLSYSLSKKNSSEIFHNAINNNEISGTEINLFTPYGPKDYKYRLIQSFTIGLINGEIPKINNPNSQRDFIYIDDVIDIIEKIIHSNQKISSIDVGSAKPTSVLEIVKEICRIMEINKEIKLDQIESKEEISYMKADLSIANEKFNWSPKIELNDGIFSTVEWIKKNYTNYYE